MALRRVPKAELKLSGRGLGTRKGAGEESRGSPWLGVQQAFSLLYLLSFPDPLLGAAARVQSGGYRGIESRGWRKLHSAGPLNRGMNGASGSAGCGREAPGC